MITPKRADNLRFIYKSLIECRRSQRFRYIWHSNRRKKSIRSVMCFQCLDFTSSIIHFLERDDIVGKVNAINCVLVEPRNGCHVLVKPAAHHKPPHLKKWVGNVKTSEDFGW